MKIPRGVSGRRAGWNVHAGQFQASLHGATVAALVVNGTDPGDAVNVANRVMNRFDRYVESNLRNIDTRHLWAMAVDDEVRS